MDEPLEYAEYGQRVRSAVVDSLIISFAVLALVFGFSVFASRGGVTQGLFTMLAYFAYSAGSTLYYCGVARSAHARQLSAAGLREYTVCYAEGGQTIGKMTTRTAVRRDDDEEASIGYVRGFIRALVPPFFWVLIIPGLLDVLWPLWDPKRQTLHDKLVGSVVVKI